jgi:hypothetical protein
MVVSTRPFTQDEIKGKKIAVPGKLTTAYLALELFAPGIEVEVVPFDQIIPQILEGKHEAGLIIHEGQLTYDKSGLHRVVDLGRWWQKVTGLPLPLGGNAIRRSLGPETMASVTQALRESIQYAIDHREEALATPCSLPAISMPSSPINSSACTSTSAPSTTATTAGKPCAPARHGAQGRDYSADAAGGVGVGRLLAISS